MISASQAAKHASAFIDYDIIVIDGFYDGFTSGPVKDPLGKTWYAVMRYEDTAENPDYDPEYHSSKATQYYRIYSLHELNKEEWDTWREAHKLFAEQVGRHGCINCEMHEHARSPRRNNKSQAYYKSDEAKKNSLLIVDLQTREPDSWTISGKYFDRKKALLEQN